MNKVLLLRVDVMLSRFLALLLVTTATPALAAEPERVEVAAEPEARPISKGRPFFDRVERIERARRDPVEQQSAPEPIVERPRRSVSSGQIRSDEPVAGNDRPRRERAERWTSPPVLDGEATDGVRNWRSRERNTERSRRRGGEPLPGSAPVLGEGVTGTRSVSPSAEDVSDLQRDGRSNISLRNRIATEGWRREWRRDRRFDWRRHRDRDWSRFNLGIYIDPFGWNYRRWNVGWRLPSRHFGRSFWIHDPFYYRLPPAYGPYRWVRYWDDALLIDLRTGRVVDVIHDFFW